MNFNVIKKGTVTSTNTLLKQQAKDLPHGTVIVADCQTGGRGRLGRSFYSPDKTGLYMSILLKEGFGSDPTLVTTLTAVAVMKAVETVTGKEARVKWVNDVLLEGKKVCGILTEGAFVGGELEYMIVGIGINTATLDFPDEIKEIAGSVGCDKSELLDAVLDCFFDEFDNLQSKKFLNFYRERCVTLNKNIKIISPGKEPVEAFARGIDDNAALIVKYTDGKNGLVSSGEVSIR
ncbi:MAG: biotin--[Clostridia bacterium]|nr:biotin--[acetyl-CoA-carboxylase] ligase [Clostridia bacterium]